MATPELAIAKATFSASLFRKDPILSTPCTRNDVDQFHQLLQDAVRQCSPPNVQKCKRWILRHVVPSPGRSAALGKYLVAVSNSFADTENDEGGRRKKPTTRRKRLHVLYVLNDVLCHTRHREPGNDGFATAVRDSLVPMFSSVGSFDAPKHIRKVQELLDIWEEKAVCPMDMVNNLRAAVEAASTGGANYLGRSSDRDSRAPSNKKEAPFMIPAMHGDPSTPWFDLPAANWLPHMQPNSTKPMNPNMIKPLQLAPGPADKALANAVKSLLKGVDRLFSKDGTLDDEPHTDLNEMGERVFIDELTGDAIGGQTYYGWSRQFCKKMKRRQKGDFRDDDRRGRSLSRSSSRSRARTLSRSTSRSRSPANKRRRLSRSHSRHRRSSRSTSVSRSRSRSRSRSQDSRSRSRSRSRSYDRGRYRRRSSSPRRNSKSRSRSPYRSLSRSRSGDRDHNKRDRRRNSPPPAPQARNGYGYGQTMATPAFQQQQQQQVQQHHIPPPPPPPPPPPQYPNHGPPHMPVPPPGFLGFQQGGPIPPPPPPPPNYTGPWPPPPPPLPMGQSPPQSVGWGGPPVGMPVPPPPSQQIVGSWTRPPNQHGRGNYNNNNNHNYRGGFGGRGRGRGGW